MVLSCASKDTLRPQQRQSCPAQRGPVSAFHSIRSSSALHCPDTWRVDALCTNQVQNTSTVTDQFRMDFHFTSSSCTSILIIRFKMLNSFATLIIFRPFLRRMKSPQIPRKAGGKGPTEPTDLLLGVEQKQEHSRHHGGHQHVGMVRPHHRVRAVRLCFGSLDFSAHQPWTTPFSNVRGWH